MTVFWIVVAMFLLGALLLVLPSLLRPGRPTVDAREAALDVHRDQWLEAERDVASGRLDAAQLAIARAEIDQRAREDAAQAEPAVARAQPARRTAIALGVLLPVAAVLLYLQLGDPEAMAPAAPQATNRHSTSPEQVQKMVAALAERLKSQPDDLEGWSMLARSYVALGRYRDAATALQRASSLAPRNPDVLADLADVSAMAQGRKLAGEPSRLIQQALDIDPKHLKALALAGTAAFEAKDYEGARSFWQRLLAQVPADSPLARSVQGSILEATALANGTPLPGAGASRVAQAASVPGAAAPAATAAASVSGQVVISPELAARVTQGDTLFVFARAVEGPRMPLAILKREAILPASFTLDDSMAMTPQMRLSGFGEVVVGARISKSGNATPQPGDLIGQSVPVRPGAKELKIVIDRAQP